MVIRDARPDELPAVGELRVRAYLAGGFLSPDSGYVPRLRSLGTQGDGHVLVAIDSGEHAGDPGDLAGPGDLTASEARIIGTIMLVLWPHTGEIVASQDEAEIRALAVAPGIQGRGIGRALLDAALARAALQEARSLVLSTQPEMRAAHRLYEQAGFTRLPHRDWSPEPGTDLLVYGLQLQARAPSAS